MELLLWYRSKWQYMAQAGTGAEIMDKDGAQKGAGAENK